MKVKIGVKTYDSLHEPIMLILNDKEKWDIGHMQDTDNKYCSFPEHISTDEIEEFMKDFVMKPRPPQVVHLTTLTEKFRRIEDNIRRRGREDE